MSNGWMTKNWTTGELNALVKNLGGESIARGIQKGEIKINPKNVMKVLFDKNGRRIPKNFSSDVCDANRNFQLNQPKLKTEIDYINRIVLLNECLGIDTGITGKQLMAGTERLLTLIQDNYQIANIAKGVYLPVVLPQLMTDDLGTVLEQYLEAVGKSYANTFDNRKFYNHRKGILANNVKIISGSRHNQLIKRMKQGPVKGIYFPSSLQEFSVNTSREQMLTLPEDFILSGMDILIAMIMYPDILARDCHAPNLDMAAFFWQFIEDSLGFDISDNHLDFDCTNSLIQTSSSSSGLLLLLE